ncbi:glycine-rich domain-containing protein [Microbulbifer sp. EKSA008]|uniref:glycine-rich domain-containing protein n=1 Tax=Microbulbifer sp. EKSA008 TaxID=3243367 RepID=UPI0040432502
MVSEGFIAICLLIVSTMLFFFYRKSQRERFLRDYQFHPSLKQRVKNKYPHLSNKQLGMVLDGLREYFIICQTAGRQMVAMPSQVIDVAWHEFILSTQMYRNFCNKSFGHFLHHTPNEVMPDKDTASEGIKRVWRIACVRSGISPSKPKWLPLIFSIDKKLGIKDGFHYSLNCRSRNSPAADHCASHIGCAASCQGGTSGSAFSGIWGGGSSSDSGSSCGGGCGGGGS